MSTQSCYVTVPVAPMGRPPEVGRRRVLAERVGEFFAVHREVRGIKGDPDFPPTFGRLWTVTHRPSGHAAAKVPTKRAAMLLARRLAQIAKEHGLSWQFTTANGAGNWPTAAKKEIGAALDTAKAEAQ